MNSIRHWMLGNAGSDYARGIDTLYMFIFWLCLVFFILIAALAIGFAWKYRRINGVITKTPYITHNTTLEIVWSIIPLIILTGLFFWGFHGFVSAGTAPGDSMEIQVTGRKWNWVFEYPDGMRSIGQLHVPLGRPIKLVMSSEDVIHSFYIPEFRVKQDVLPNRYTELWFYPEHAGVYQVLCTEYCGKSHSDMMAKVHVDSPEKYAEWLEKGDEEIQKMPLPELGKLVWENRGCAQCHSIDGSKGQGPSFKGIYGHEVTFTDGTKLASIDANYIRESILNPQAKVVTGFEPVMPTFQGLLREREILGVIEYIKSLK